MIEEGDYWTEQSAHQLTARVDRPIFTEYRGLSPDDSVGGTARPKLTELLFSESPELSAFVLLDPSLAFGLLDELENAGIFYRCLFRDPVDGSGEDAYPWLVELEPGSPILRKLCRSADIGGWWDEEPGIFIRTSMTPERLWSHLRKFHRIADVNGRWFLLRYWDPELLVRLIEIDLAALSGLIRPEICLIARWADKATVITRSGSASSATVKLHPGDSERIGAIMTGRRVRNLGSRLRAAFGPNLDNLPDTDLWRQIAGSLEVADRIGLRDGELRAKFMIMSVVTVPGMHHDEKICSLLRRAPDPDQRFRELQDVIRRRADTALHAERDLPRQTGHS